MLRRGAPCEAPPLAAKPACIKAESFFRKAPLVWTLKLERRGRFAQRKLEHWRVVALAREWLWFSGSAARSTVCAGLRRSSMRAQWLRVIGLKALKPVGHDDVIMFDRELER
jgi:hypothetical protein